MAVYGIAENKCLKEVYSKENFKVYDFKVNVGVNSNGGVQVPAVKLGLDDPTKWVAISASLVYDSITHLLPRETANGSWDVSVGLATICYIYVSCNDAYQPIGEATLRIVLMKVK